MAKRMDEVHKATAVIAPQDVGTGDVTGSWVDARDAEKVQVFAQAGAVTADKILTVTLMQATSSGGAGAKAVGSPVTSVGVGGAAPPAVKFEKYVGEIDSAGGFRYVTAKLRIDEAAKLGSAWIVLGGALRY